MTNLGRESETVEFKESTVEMDSALTAMVAMLNKRCYGTVYFGVKDNGTVIGQDVGKQTITKISQAFKNHIDPMVIPQIDVISNDDGKEYLKVFAEGNNRPYAFRGDIFIRSGEENKKIPMTELRKLFQSTSDLLKASRSINQDLTFDYLCSRFRSRGFHVNDDAKFYRSYSLLNDKGEFNIQAELLSDQNPTPLTVVIFAGKDRSSIAVRKQFTGSLIKTMSEVNDYIESLNEISVDMSESIRKDIKMIDSKAFDEAWTNACVHNTWMLGIPPTIHVFTDRLEIISYGGTPYFQTLEEFFNGETMPVNESLMQIFLAVGATEHTGHGIPVIVDAYGKDSFSLDNSSIVITMAFPFERGGGMIVSHDSPALNEKESNIVRMMIQDPHSTIDVISNDTGISRSNVGKIVKSLKERGLIERRGSKKTGIWIVSAMAQGEDKEAR
ncbi:MAG: putative DNA binding domain-containing protein [Candidatus Methanomethylophilaceae archaeon]|nr:putative DNA binding domain-containing protein [Candidatus Methanomethylophilaceae archaeon]